jgi:hypothetical protein
VAQRSWLVTSRSFGGLRRAIDFRLNEQRTIAFGAGLAWPEEQRPQVRERPRLLPVGPGAGTGGVAEAAGGVTT